MPGGVQDEYKEAPGQVVASDFYHSNELMPLSDDAIVEKTVRNIAACEPGFLGAKVRAWVLPAPVSFSRTVWQRPAWLACTPCSVRRHHMPCVRGGSNAMDREAMSRLSESFLAVACASGHSSPPTCEMLTVEH